MARMDVESTPKRLECGDAVELGPLGVEEKRTASLPDEEELSSEDKTAVVLTTLELTPIPEASSSTVDEALVNLADSSDWLQQYEAVVSLRRLVVHHSELVTAQQVDAFLGPLALEGDNLRSAVAKNALLAAAECFEFLPRVSLEPPLLAGAHPEVLDVLLRRSVCEKRFLRDASAFAVQKLVAHLAGLPLLAAAARYGTSKNSRVCGVAAHIIAASLLTLQQLQDVPDDGDATDLQHRLAREDGRPLRAVLRALAAFRESKDTTARSEAAAALRRLGEVLGRDGVETALRDAFATRGQAGVVARMLKDAFPTAQGCRRPLRRTGSLRERMLGKEAQVGTAGASTPTAPS